MGITEPGRTSRGRLSKPCFCVTPEFPDGIYAYFVSVDASGAPTFPYNIGRTFYGNPTGSTVTSITETVTSVFKGGPDTQEQMKDPALSGLKIIVLSAAEDLHELPGVAASLTKPAPLDKLLELAAEHC